MPAHIDSKEHTEVAKRYHFIAEKFQKYIDGFIEGLKQEPLQPKYRFSSLTYYKEILLSC
jgi:protein AbiQ